MRFYDRENELKLLEFLNDKRPSFVVISVKHRVGKTELIKKFIEDKNALYFFVEPYNRDFTDFIAYSYIFFIKSESLEILIS